MDGDLDCFGFNDLAVIYGYETRYFNRQVNNNIERFDLEARFQLSNDEFKNLMCKKFTSSWGFTCTSISRVEDVMLYKNIISDLEGVE